MKIPLSWLKEYLPTHLSPAKIADSLTRIGLEVESYDTGEDPLFEIGLTPNLAHCASIRGVARELAAVTLEKLSSPQLSFVESKETPPPLVTVENFKSCPRYSCRLIEKVHVAPSPDWLQKRLEQVGVRPVNNIVDITNLVLLELGLPLHAFDFDKLEGREIRVRFAHPDEKIVTLDAKEHLLSPDILVIADRKKAQAIAGIMGGLESEISTQTKTVLLEAAFFEPKQVRRASKRLGIHTEASYRFERGVDPHATLEALDRATTLILALAGGQSSQLVDKKESSFALKTVCCRLVKVNSLLGTQLSLSEVETLLGRLGFQVIKSEQNQIHVLVPSYRHDIHQEVDLIDEVCRLYDLNQIHKKERSYFRTGALFHSPLYLFEKNVRGKLLNEGLQELLTCDLIGMRECEWLGQEVISARTLIPIQNPRSQDQSLLRPSLLPGLLRVLRHNIHHGQRDFAGFEIGKIHFKMGENFAEPYVASLLLSGKKAPPHWDVNPPDYDFYDLKGIVENLMQSLKIKEVHFVLSRYTNFHPGQQASLIKEGKEIGIIGQIHPETAKKNDLSQPIFFAELNLEELLLLTPKENTMVPLPSFPASDRDWTFTVLEQCVWDEIFLLIRQTDSKLLESATLLDVYRNDKLGSEWKNVTLRFIYRDHQKTISQQIVDAEHARIKEDVWVKLKKGRKVKES